MKAMTPDTKRKLQIAVANGQLRMLRKKHRELSGYKTSLGSPLDKDERLIRKGEILDTRFKIDALVDHLKDLRSLAS